MGLEPGPVGGGGDTQPQTDVVARIAGVLREQLVLHGAYERVDGVVYLGQSRCDIDPTHVAAAVVAALGLTEEKRNAYIGVGRWADPIHPKNYQDQHRWTSPWVAVDGSTPK